MDSRQLQKYIEGELSRDESREVFEWISASEKNAAQYRAQRRIHEVMLWDEKLTGMPAAGRARLPRALGYLMACAASLALFVLGSLIYQKTRPALPDGLAVETVTSPAGKTVELNLADGSHVSLNANSTLRILPSARNARREVYLDGEGFFQVSRDESRPFIVRTGKLAVEVLGTEFNVNAHEEDKLWEVSLMDGSVAILDRQDRELTTLTPGVKASYVDGHLVKSPVNEGTYLWKDGILFFDNLTLGEILDRISAFYGVRFDTSSCKNLQRRYTGKFRANDGYEHILKVLQIGNRFRYDFQEETDGLTILIKS